MTETIDGVQYSGIRRNYAIVPETAGTYTLPPATIDFKYSDDGKFIQGTAQLPPTQFTAVSPTGSDKTALPFAARDVSLTQSFDRDPAKLKAGEALVRTVTIFAGNTQAMMIPPLEIGQAQGLQTYSQSPQLADGVNRDQIDGSSRTETITYVAAAPGTFQLPSISLEWFDTLTKTTKTASLPAVDLSVAEAQAPTERIAPNVQASEAAAPAARQRTMRMIAVATLLIAVLSAVFLAGRRWLSPIRQWLTQRRQMRAESGRSASAGCCTPSSMSHRRAFTLRSTTGAMPLVTGRLRPGQPPVATPTFAVTSSNSIDCSTVPAHQRLRSIGQHSRLRSRETGMRGNTRHARRAEIRCPS